MRRTFLSLGLAGLLTALAVSPALAAQTNTYAVKAKVTPAKGGTKAKPKPVIDGPGSSCGGVGTLPRINAKFVPFAGGGTALQFELPPTVMHPVTGLTVAVKSVSSTPKRGALESVGYKGAKRTVAVSFLTEAGQTSTVTTTA